VSSVHGVGHRRVELLLVHIEGIAQDLSQKLARAAGDGDVLDRGIGGVVVGPIDGAAAYAPASTNLRTAGAGGQENGKAGEEVLPRGRGMAA
jgi:hypothetical protein